MYEFDSEPLAVQVSGYLAVLRARWLRLAAAAFITGAVFFAASFLSKPVFTATGVITPSDAISQVLSSQMGLMGGSVTSALSRSLLGAGAGDRSTEYQAVLNSEGFARRVILERDWVPLLFPDNWNPGARKWDTVDRVSLNPIAWIGSLRTALTPPPVVGVAQDDALAKKARAILAAGGPNMDTVIKRFRGAVTINLNERTGFITITATLRSPTDARMVVNVIVEELNRSERDRARQEARAEVRYLLDQVSSTENATLRTAYMGVLERQLKIEMLSAVVQDYAVRQIVHPVVPEVKSAPVRRLHFIFGFLVGLLGVAGFELFRFVRSS